MPLTELNEPDRSQRSETHVKIISHSDLFYWWPVWAVGFLMTALTYQDGHRIAFVPDGTIAERGRVVESHEGPRDVLVIPAGLELPLDPVTKVPLQPRLRIAVSNNIGAVFATVLILVILVTNVRLRGVWTLVALLLIALLSVIFALKGWWDHIFQIIGMADIHINAFGYLCIASTLFAIWLIVFVFVDRLTYVSFSRGQFQVHLAVGGGKTAYEVLGMVIHKRRDDLFRHWILGLGSGDLVVTTGGANPQTFELPNVLFIGRKLALAQQMLQEREVVRGE